MREEIVRKLLMYLLIWGGLFILLCIVSIIKNWSTLVAVMGGTITSMISMIVMVVFMIYIFMMILGIRR